MCCRPTSHGDGVGSASHARVVSTRCSLPPGRLLHVPQSRCALASGVQGQLILLTPRRGGWPPSRGSTNGVTGPKDTGSSTRSSSAGSRSTSSGSTASRRLPQRSGPQHHVPFPLLSHLTRTFARPNRLSANGRADTFAQSAARTPSTSQRPGRPAVEIDQQTLLRIPCHLFCPRWEACPINPSPAEPAERSWTWPTARGR